jgi:hypothetical protein
MIPNHPNDLQACREQIFPTKALVTGADGIGPIVRIGTNENSAAN